MIRVMGILCLFLLIGCNNVQSVEWMPDRRPETIEERRCVAEIESKILERHTQTLSGHDQDWEDSIEKAHKIASDTCCKTRLYGYYDGWKSQPTGRMREMND